MAEMKFDIIGALRVVGAVILAYITIVVLTLIGMIVSGVLVQSVTSGNIPVDSATATLINTTAQTLTNLWTTITSGTTIAIGLLALVVVLVVFKSFFKFGGRSGNGGASF